MCYGMNLLRFWSHACLRHFRITVNLSYIYLLIVHFCLTTFHLHAHSWSASADSWRTCSQPSYSKLRRGTMERGRLLLLWCECSWIYHILETHRLYKYASFLGFDGIYVCPLHLAVCTLGRMYSQKLAVACAHLSANSRFFLDAPFCPARWIVIALPFPSIFHLPCLNITITPVHMQSAQGESSIEDDVKLCCVTCFLTPHRVGRTLENSGIDTYLSGWVVYGCGKCIGDMVINTVVMSITIGV